MIELYNIKFISHHFFWLPILTHFANFAMAPSVRESNPFSISHWFWWQSSSSKTIWWAIARFCILCFHICLTCKLWRNSFLCLLQNSTAKCCTHHDLLFEYVYGLVNSPGGGMTTFIFIVKRLPVKESGISLFESLMVSMLSLFLSQW